MESLTWADAVVRVSLSLFFGFLLGYDRDKKNKPVDFRVFMIVASTTCLLAIMGTELTELYSDNGNNIDLGVLRIVQGVLTGIGFLGAGAIMKRSEDDSQILIGTTTGASIWSAGSMGLMLGFGLYSLALLGFGILLIILVIFGYLQRPLLNRTDSR